ncbi:Ferrichrome-iron receptor [plant metagenome]
MHFAPASRRLLSPAFRRTALATSLKLALSAVVVAAPALLAPTAAHAQSQTRSLDIPGGPLGDVLGRYGREAGIMLSFRPELTEGQQSAGLKGSYSVGGGLEALLAGTGLRAVQQTNGSYVVNRTPGAGQAANMLPTVTVTAASDSGLPPAYAGGQVARGGGLGVLGSADVMDTPFSTTNYTAQMLEDQQARTLADVVVNEASVRMMTSTGSFSEDFQIRGFNVTSGDIGLNGLYGLTSSHRMPAALMERVEVLKGPGTLMYGISPNGSIGGNINIVTKRAGDEPLTRLTTSYESKSIFSTHLDMGRRFGDANQWGIRFNGVYRNGQTSLDNGRQEFGLGALALDYRSPKLRWSLDTYAQKENVDNFRAQNGFHPNITSIPSAPSGHRAIYSGADLTTRDATVATRLEYDISDRLMVYAAGGYRYGASEQDFPSARTTDAVDSQGNFRVINSWYDAYTRNKTAEIGARANFDTFGVKHMVSLSGSTLRSEAGSFYLSAPLGEKIDSNIYHPVPLIPMTGDRRSPAKNSETELTSLSVTDTVSFANDRVMLTGGLRKQRVKTESFNAAGAVTSTYDADGYSPLAGLVVRPWENVSLYGNFTAGLTRGSIVGPGYANTGAVLPPYKSKQYEAGVKVDWDRLITTVSVFQITRPSAIADQANVYGLNGEQRNRGLELSAVGEIVPGLRVMSSATFYDAKLQRTAGGVNQGNDANGVPKYTFNLGADWDLPWVPGLSVNARAIHTASTPYNAENTQTLPSWTRYDIGARYHTEVMGRPVTFRATVENLFDKNYWLSSSTLLTVGTVAAPRTVLLSAQIDF